MGVSVDFYIMHGVKVTEEQYESLSEEEQDSLLESDNYIQTDPMCSTEGIFGTIVTHLREDDPNLAVTDLDDLVRVIDLSAIEEIIPDYLKEKHISTYAFVRLG